MFLFFLSENPVSFGNHMIKRLVIIGVLKNDSLFYLFTKLVIKM